MKNVLLCIVAFITIISNAQEKPELLINSVKPIANQETFRTSKNEHLINKDNRSVHWQVTFEETEPVWTFGMDSGDKSWHVTNANGTPQVWETAQGTYFEQLGDFSETGENWAWVDGVADILSGTYQICNTWIQFDNIDLSDVDNPKLSFY